MNDTTNQGWLDYYTGGNAGGTTGTTGATTGSPTISGAYQTAPAGNVQQVLDDPYLRALREYIFNTGMAFAGQPLPVEALVNQIAPFNPLEQRAIDIAAGGVGSYFPYLRRGAEMFESAADYYPEAAALTRESVPYYNEAVSGYRDAANLARSGLQPTERGIYEAINMLNAGLGSFDQRAANYYMNPYMNAVVQDQLNEVDKYYDQQITNLGTQLAGSGLRGSARGGLLELELAKEKEKRRSELLNSGLASAYNQAQQQFNLEQGALRGSAPVMASFGQGFGAARSGLAGLLNDLSSNVGNIGSNYLRTGSALMGIPAGIQSLGGAMTNLGGIEQAFRGNDISNLNSAGLTARAYEQAVLDTQRQNAYKLAMEPYSRLSYLSTFASPQYMGSGQTTNFFQQQGYQPSPMQGTMLATQGGYAQPAGGSDPWWKFWG